MAISSPISRGLGRSSSSTSGFVFHYRERGDDGSLRGLFIQDSRNPDDVAIYIAERGDIVEKNGDSYLLLEKGSTQRPRGSGDASIITFDDYAIDLAEFIRRGDAKTKPRERDTWSLLSARPEDPAAQCRRPHPRRNLRSLHQSAVCFRGGADRLSPRSAKRAPLDRAGGGRLAASILMFAAVRVAGITDSLLLRGKPGVPLPLWIPTLAWAIPIVSAIVALDYIFGGPLAARRLARPGSGQAFETRVMILGVLGRYFALRFTKTVLAVFGGVFVLIFTIDTVETLRRSGDTAAATAALVAWLAFLHTPIVAEQVMPFAALLGSMIAFLNLSRRLELVVARAAGVSVWQFLAPALIVAVAMGVLEISVYNPLSTFMKRQSEALEAQLIGGPANSGIGSWFSQQSVDGLTIVHAERAGDNVFAHFQAFNFDPDGKFSQRVDAERAILHDGFWELRNTTVVAPGFDTQTAGVFLLATNLSETRRFAGFLGAGYRIILAP